jgi:hypothetical protein
MAAEACAVEGVDGLLKWLRRFSENSVTMLRRAFVQSFVKLVQPLPQLRKDVTALAGIIADVASHAAQSSSAMKMGIVSKQLPRSSCHWTSSNCSSVVPFEYIDVGRPITDAL